MGGHLVSFESEEDIKEMNDIAKGFVSSDRRMEAMQYWTGLRYTNNDWSFSDRASTEYAKTKLPGLTNEGRKKCFLFQVATYGRNRPKLWMKSCSSNQNFICQLNCSCSDDSSSLNNSINKSTFNYLFFFFVFFEHYSVVLSHDTCYHIENFSCNLQCNSNFERCKFGNYETYECFLPSHFEDPSLIYISLK